MALNNFKRWFSIALATLAVVLFSVKGVDVHAEELDSFERVSEELSIDDFEVSEPMTYAEIIAEYAKDSEISFEEAMQEMDPGMEMLSSAELYNTKYRTLSTTLYVTSSYRPQLRYYCRTQESGNFRAIKRVMSVNMNRSYKGVSKAFSGTVYTHLRDPNIIYFIVNGDFYNYGTTTVNGGLGLSLGQKGTASFSVSYSSRHYKYFYKEGNKYY